MAESRTGSPAGFPGTERYRVQRQLGAGATGDVFACLDVRRGGQVALKTLRHLRPATLLAFKAEFRRIADLHHPNLIDLYELVADGDRWFFTMELVDGRSFGAWVRGVAASSVALADTLAPDPDAVEAVPAPLRIHAPLTDDVQFDRLRHGLRQIVAGLQALHDAGKLHRDIKPSNVLVTEAGRVVILDFGLVAEQAGDHDRRVVGTPAYMAPEQGRGESPTPACDWYSVGALLYEAMVGEPPFAGTAVEVIADKQSRDAPPVADRCPAAPADLAALCQELLAREPAARPGGDDIAARLGETGRRELATPVSLIGRQSQLAALTEAWAAAEAGPVAVLVEGASGMGKSALIDCFIRGVRDEATVLQGRCYQSESVPYKAVDDIVDAVARRLSAMTESERGQLVPDELELSARLFPVLAQFAVSSETAAPADQTELRRRGFAALAELLSRLARRRRLLVFVDDLQWGDADSVPLLRALLDGERGAPLLLLAAARSEEAGAAPVRALVAAGAGRVELAPLADAEAIELASALLGGDRERAAAVAAEAGGNPFFVGELSRQPDAVGVGLAVAIRRRVATLSPSAQRVLEVVAVAGRPVARELIAAASGRDDEQVAALSQLRAAHLVRIAGDGRVDTFHDRIRESVAEGLDDCAARSLHAALARALQSAGDEDPDALARHWLGAGDVAEAARHVRAAAARASASLAFERAAQLLALALEIEPESADRRSLELQLADAQARGGWSREAADRYAALAPGDGSIEDLRLRGLAARQYLISGHFASGHAELRRVAPHLGIALPRSRRGIMAALVGRRMQLRLRGLRAGRKRELGDRERVALETCGSAALGLLLVDSLSATYFHTRHLLFALRAGDDGELAQALAMEGGLLIAVGRRERGRTLLDRASALAAEVREPLADIRVQMARMVGASYAGDWQESLAHGEHAEVLIREQAPTATYEDTNVALTRTIPLYYLGDFAALRRHVLRTDDRARGRGNLLGALGVATGVANASWLAADLADQAIERLDEASELWADHAVHSLHYDTLARAQIALYRGEHELAHRLVSEVRPAIRRAGLLRLQRIRIEVAELAGRTALAVGDRAGAERAAREVEREAQPWADSLAALLRAGAAADADALAGAAEQLAARAMQAYACAAAWRAGDAGALSRLQALGVVRPEPFAAMLAPAYP